MNEPWLTALFWLWYPQSPAQYHPGPAPLCCPNRCDPSSQCTIWQGRGWAGVAVGLWSTSSLIHPTIKNTLKNKRLFGQSRSPGAWGSSVCLPRLSTLYPCQFLSELQLFPRSFGQDIKQDPRGSDPQPFPTRGIHTATTANCLDYDNSASRWRKSGKKKGLKKRQTISQSKTFKKKKNCQHEKV